MVLAEASSPFELNGEDTTGICVLINLRIRVHWKLIEGKTCKQSISYMLQMVEEFCTEDWVNMEERATLRYWKCWWNP